MARVSKSKLRQEFTYTYVRDWWLIKFHNTNSAEVAAKYPQEAKSGEWWSLYKVTQAQHDEWEKWFYKEICYRWDISLARAKKSAGLDYVECAPSIKE